VVTAYTYDAAGRLTRAQRGAASIMYGYDDANRPTNKTFRNGVQGQFSYDDANRLTSISYLASGNPLWSGQYTYNKVGNRITRTVGSTTLNYGYDKLDRLVWVKNGATTLSSYQYDAVGNRTRKAASGKSTLYSYDAANQMTAAGSASYSYDQNGNLSTVQNGGITAYTFDGEDRLTGITFPDATTNAFVYNGDGLRVKSISKSGAVSKYVWSGSDVINEYDGSMTLSKSYHLGAGLEGQCVGSGSVHYYATDGLGSVMSLTDEAGLATDTYEFDEFGVQTAATGTTSNVYRYTGQQRDGESGLYYLRARYYDPSTGRFISQDPVKGDINEPITLNPYVYCGDNPANSTDPSGLIWMKPGEQGKYQRLIRFLKTLQSTINNDCKLRQGLEKHGKLQNPGAANGYFQWKKGDYTGNRAAGPEIAIGKNSYPACINGNTIYINTKLALDFEKGKSGPASDGALLLFVEAALTHEFVHWGLNTGTEDPEATSFTVEVYGGIDRTYNVGMRTTVNQVWDYFQTRRKNYSNFR